MRWCQRLYVGEKAKKCRYGIIQGLRSKKLQPEVYVITPAANGNNLFDIYPSAMLLLPPLCGEDLLILGIAVTYWEALEVARDMVEDLYRSGGPDGFRNLTGQKAGEWIRGRDPRAEDREEA